MDKPYKQPKMVNWFGPVMLLNAALKAIVAGTFGNYADRREVEAALNNSTEEQTESDELNHDYSVREEMWIDFIGDTGDGFNSTYSVALTAAQPELTVEVNGEIKKIPRGKILCFGGDQVYPTPSADAYEAKFRTPFRAALPADENDQDRPHLYAIPGNHDWYDGLGNFIKVFCQERWIGNWMTKQHRSYFALQLPYRYWIWATDIQLNADIDQPQLDFFLNLARSDRMKAGDKVILITAEPAWIYREMYENDKSYDRLKYFTDVYITKDKYGIVGKKFELSAALTGDLHHYSHYSSPPADGVNQPHFFGAGGGGAFMHLTNNLPEKLDKIDEKNVQLQKRFPSMEESQKLLAGNLLFPFKNFTFAAFIGCFYLMLAWLSQSIMHMLSENFSLEDSASNIHSWADFTSIAQLFLYAPPVIILSLAFFAGLLFFTDTRSGKRGIRWIGFLHALVQTSMIFLLLWLFSKVNLDILNLKSRSILQVLLYSFECIFIGGSIAGFIMGSYLYFCNRFLNIHLDEASSSLSCQDFKNFLRIHVSKEGVTIYPVGIRTVIKNWKQEGSGEKLHFISQPLAGKIPDYHLIQPPVFIKNQQP